VVTVQEEPHPNKIYSPPSTFDIDYERLVNLAKERNFVFTSVDLVKCEQDIVDQRAAHAEHDAAEAKYREVHAKLAVGQRERFVRYSQLLGAARGAFRADPAMLAVLKKFNRRFTHRTEAESA
jgi:trimethylamine:corrinoid methyltransferase-like protein